MFSGIVEAAGKVIALKKENDNIHLSISCPFVAELKIDQSIAHNGVCLTIVDIEKVFYTVTAIKETLTRTNLGKLRHGDLVNLERSTKLGERLDGHIVQGHADCTAVCTGIKKEKGSHVFSFECDKKKKDARLLIVEKGSITVNGVSLTVTDCADGNFSVAIIPYTYDNTNFPGIKKGSAVNIEFDIIGKYVLNTLR